MPSDSVQSTAEVERTVQAAHNSVAGTGAVAFRSLDAPSQRLFVTERSTIHAAGTMKVPVMVELYRQAHEDWLDLDAPLRVTNEFRSVVDGSTYALTLEDDCDEALYDPLGETQTRPIRTLVREIITAGSNLATNILVEKAGAENVTQTMRRYGAHHIQVRRGVEDGKAYRRGLNNETTAHDLLVILERMARRATVSEQASEDIIDILSDQEYNDVIPGRLPESVEGGPQDGLDYRGPPRRWHRLRVRRAHVRPRAAVGKSGG